MSVAGALAGSELQRRAVLIATRVTMLDAVQRRRAHTVERLMSAVADLTAELDPDGRRDHRSRWEAGTPSIRGADLFDRIRWTSDELVVLSGQFVGWQGAEAGSTYDEAVAMFGRILEREGPLIERLERDVPTVQLWRAHHPTLRAAALPVALKRLRAEHDKGAVVLEYLSTLAD